MDAGMRGTNAAQDSRFKDKEAASIKATKFPKHFSEKVDLRKVNLTVLRGWIAQKVTELIKFEDDVVVEYVFGMLEDKEKPIPDPRKMQVSLVGFMDKHGAAAFMDALWSLLLSAQSTVGGVPAEFIEAKKKELQAKQEEDRKLQERNFGRPSAQDSFDRRRAVTDTNTSLGRLWATVSTRPAIPAIASSPLEGTTIDPEIETTIALEEADGAVVDGADSNEKEIVDMDNVGDGRDLEEVVVEDSMVDLEAGAEAEVRPVAVE